MSTQYQNLLILAVTFHVVFGAWWLDQSVEHHRANMRRRHDSDVAEGE